MSPDPEHGVVDENCRVHGLRNLYIAGCSVFPTSGIANPTLTIIALAMRLSDHLKSDMGVRA
jgi:choline dehydrogenase-like flavoprotein